MGTKVCFGTTPNGLKKCLLKGVLEVTKLISFLLEKFRHSIVLMVWAQNGQKLGINEHPDS